MTNVMADPRGIIELRTPGDNLAKVVIAPCRITDEDSLSGGVFLALANGEQVLDVSSVRELINALNTTLEAVQEG